MTRIEEARAWQRSAVQHIRECSSCDGRLCRIGRILDREADAAYFRTTLPERAGVAW